MPDFVLADLLAVKTGLSAEDLKRFEAAGILEPVRKNGRTYYSAHDVLQLKGVLHLTRARGMTLEQAEAHIARRGLLHVAGD
jgi:DNA-binding transcriptional MerR regulator